ncbi:hypothetical protein BC835DRAFT_168362 [Cytidiella melzeri]|nr:hypothetical protein BC835DRAFT_168362 [Cytidiella melzeri]
MPPKEPALETAHACPENIDRSELDSNHRDRHSLKHHPFDLHYYEPLADLIDVLYEAIVDLETLAANQSESRTREDDGMNEGDSEGSEGEGGAPSAGLAFASTAATATVPNSLPRFLPNHTPIDSETSESTQSSSLLFTPNCLEYMEDNTPSIPSKPPALLPLACPPTSPTGTPK